MDQVENQEAFEEEEYFEESSTLEELKEKVEEAKKLFFEKRAEAKEMFAEKSAEVKDKIDDVKLDFKEKLEDKKEIISDRVDDRKDAVSEKADELKEVVENKADDVKDHLKDAKEDLQEMYKESKNGFNEPDLSRDEFMLTGSFSEQGYDWWWHSFTGYNTETGKAKTFFIEYYLINPGLGGSEVVYGQLPENKEAGIMPSYMMVKAGALGEKPVQIHRFFPWDEVTIEKGIPFMVSADTCLCTEDKIIGNVKVSKKAAKEHPEYMCDGGSMSWDLAVDKEIAFNVGHGASKPVRDAKAYDMFWHAEGMKTYYSGIVKFGKEEYEVRPKDCYGYADKNWGRDYTSPWLWLSSNNLFSKISGKQLENSVFNIGGGKPKMGNIEFDDKLLGAFWYEGTPIEFNFTKAWTLPKTQFKVVEGKNKVTWKVIQETPAFKMYTSISCNKNEMIFNNYEAPNGEKSHNRLWCGGTGEGYIKLFEKKLSGLKKEWKLVEYIDVKNCGCEYGEY